MDATPPDVAALLAAAPSREYALLELALKWPTLSDAQERIAARLRLVVLTRDPLDWIPQRGASWATVYADGDTLDELAVAHLQRQGSGVEEVEELARREHRRVAVFEVEQVAVAGDEVVGAGGAPAR